MFAALGPAHQLMTKPFDPNPLIAAIFLVPLTILTIGNLLSLFTGLIPLQTSILPSSITAS